MKVIKKHFERFKKEFLRQVDRLGLKEYDIRFHFEKRKEFLADIWVNETNKMATIEFSSTPLNKNDARVFEPKLIAKHEVAHLLTHKLFYLAHQRFVDFEEIKQEWERLATILEKIL